VPVRSSSLLRRTLLALIVGGLVLALPACGSFASPAATVNGTVISQDELARQLNAVLLQPQFAQQVAGPTGAERRRELARQLLAFLVRQQVLVDYAERSGIHVASAAVDARLAQAVQQAGGQRRFDQELRTSGLTEADVRTNIEDAILAQRVQDIVVAQRGGPSGSDQQAVQARTKIFTDWLDEQVARADIEVNPRYGRFDPKNGEICAVTSTAATVGCAPGTP
jgi:hypothetical protein